LRLRKDTIQISLLTFTSSRHSLEKGNPGEAISSRPNLDPRFLGDDNRGIGSIRKIKL
jgi:hypothetical protein